jgi:hypothetical protein|eukprot:CAMPEP_0174281166 /NCGR_PEP_ID=MMETSP0809-20121228/1519_1 /TAXON_ID=73025 ORGANISM="Eutreptiella gymnastica-like, Strain CCMP1594" /NCGR_SAMPLE_ID=MMETSP0809 /ASSEMBLY_ACC=CAM_ASM_000658 /LENGTH=109 /DNA_ID=CAMNT_0015374527 /DNA_START=17 /DNA_END=346 /DNA_ORIENTATION=+
MSLNRGQALVLTGSATVLMIGALIYASCVGGSMLQSKWLTPWMNATLVDLYICIAFLLAWVYSKEETWAACMIWTLAFVCLGSMGVAAYVALQLMKLSSLQAPSEIWGR